LTGEATLTSMSADPSDLARVWADTAASLPPGWELGGLRCASTGLTPEDRSEEWIVIATGPDGLEVKHQAAEPRDALEGLLPLLRGAANDVG
jgi:hypothetical protein